MKVFVDGREVNLDQVHEYALGPLRLHAHDDLAAAYNRVVKAYLEAKIAYEDVVGRAAPAMEYLTMQVSAEDLAIYEHFGFAIQEAIDEYDGPPFSPEKLDQAFLLRV